MHLQFLDGTRDERYGKASLSAFAELAKYTRIRLVGQAPGTLDMDGFMLVKRAESRAYNRQTGQISHYVLGAEANRETKGVPVILVERDLFKPGINWCYGGVSTTSEGKPYLALSTYRLEDTDLFTHVLTHELGHLYGAAPKGRINTISNLGSHCTNRCIMQQKSSEPAMQQHAREMLTLENKFCTECQSDLKRASIEWRNI